MKICSVENCDRSVRAHGLCDAHYQRERKGTDLNSPILEQMRNYSETCSVENCDRKAKRKGMCGAHYQRKRKGTDLTSPVGVKVEKKCLVENCDRLVNARGMCKLHYERNRRGLDLYLPIRAPDGTGHINDNGYRVHHINGKSIPEHRLVMEQFIERPLFPDETVHHINGVRDDNRIENLELWVSNHPSGQRVEDIVSWAKELIARYEPTPINYELEEAW